MGEFSFVLGSSWKQTFSWHVHRNLIQKVHCCFDDRQLLLPEYNCFSACVFSPGDTRSSNSFLTASDFLLRLFLKLFSFSLIKLFNVWGDGERFAVFERCIFGVLFESIKVLPCAAPPDFARCDVAPGDAVGFLTVEQLVLKIRSGILKKIVCRLVA